VPAPVQVTDFAVIDDEWDSNVSDYDLAVAAYSLFLEGKIEAHDPDAKRSGDSLFLQDILYVDYTATMYAFYDINDDGVPELHLRPTAGFLYDVFTYRDGEVIWWYMNTAYCLPFNIKAILYERRGISHDDINYMYISLDSDGYELSRDILYKYRLEFGSRYVINEEEVSADTWEEYTSNYLQNQSEEIIWRDVITPR